MIQNFRMAAGGVVDRSRTIGFRFDGRAYQGHPGDTLASALMANGVRLVGRSFKLHRPRGIFAAGAEEPNALAELRTGARREPNTRMTQIELYDGLEAASQNRWPSLRWDVLSLNGLIAPLLSAGFYYKTFMWPASFWEKVYEPLIRRAAGLGRASGEADPDRYDTMHAHCDVLVIGGGVAGLAAALVAGAAGARVMLCEQDFVLGAGLIGEDAAWRAAALERLGGLDNVTLLTRTNVFGAYDANVVGALERVADHVAAPGAFVPRQRYWTIRAGRIVHATGAYERFIAFPDNDRPGVMLAGAAATYVARYGVHPGRRALLFANNDAAYQSIFTLQDAGITVAGVVDPRGESAAQAAARARGITVWSSSQVVGTAGSLALTGARVARIGSAGTDALVAADVLCVSGGINPAVQLATQSRTAVEWSERLAGWVPGTAVLPQFSAGAANGVTGLREAAADGARAGAAASGGEAAIGLPADRPADRPAASVP